MAHYRFLDMNLLLLLNFPCIINGFINRKRLKPILNLCRCGTMENVWGELKKIEAQAEQITSEAQSKAKQITATSKQQAQTLIDNSKVDAEAEAQKLHADAVAKANEEREKQLKANQAEIRKLKVNAEKHVDQAVKLIVNAVLEEN